MKDDTAHILQEDENMYKVSTQTFIVYTNIGAIELESVFDGLDVSSEIVGIKYGSHIKGSFHSTGASVKNLRCLTLRVPVIDEQEPSKRSRRKVGPKTVCVKIFRNGTVQLTGCKSETHARVCLTTTFAVLNVTKAVFHLQSVMLNVAYQLNQTINKEKFARFLYAHESVNVPPLTNDSIGLKIKIPYPNPVLIDTYEFSHGEFSVKEPIAYNVFFATNCKKLNRSFGTSVTVFVNGKVAMSGINKTVVEYTIDWLKNALERAKNDIVDQPKEIKTFRR